MRKYLIILDIDSTLITNHITKSDQIPVYNGPDLIIEDGTILPSEFKIRVWKRPFLDAFMSYVVDNFYVAIWTAATIEWLDFILKSILAPYAHKFIFTWSQNQTGNHYTKPLTRVWERFPMFDKDNTLLIDDLSNVTGNQWQKYYCHLNIVSFDYKPNFLNDMELLKIMSGLRILISQHGYIETRKLIEAYERVK